jgi:hypothetical protein
LTEILLAIDRWLDERDASQSLGVRTPAFGSRAVKRISNPPPARLSLRPPRTLNENPAGVSVSAVDPINQSEPPIPLVRRSIPDDYRTHFDKGTDPGVGASSSFATLEMDEAGEPVIGLYRSKLAPSPPVPVGSEERLKEAQARIDGATSADSVVSGLMHGLEALATRALVLSVRGRVFEGRAGSSSLGDSDGLRTLRVDANQPTVLETAIQAGYFLGHMPPTPWHQGLRQLFGDGEVYVGRIDVSGRPALLFVMAGLQTAFGATRRADELAHASSRALERIVRSRKQG